MDGSCQVDDMCLTANMSLSNRNRAHRLELGLQDSGDGFHPVVDGDTGELDGDPLPAQIEDISSLPLLRLSKRAIRGIVCRLVVERDGAKAERA